MEKTIKRQVSGNPTDLICFHCKHYHDFGVLRCDAFGKFIPWQIAEGLDLHSSPMPGQKNDITGETNDIIFEPIE
jgi:hypothetical protein